MEKKRFHLKEDHIKLLQNMNIRWNNKGYGSPEVDSKRPFGNSGTKDIEEDICDYLNLNKNNEDDIEYARNIYDGLDVAMEIVLSLKTFDSGVFEAEKYGGEWSRVAVEHDGECPSCNEHVSLSIASMYGEWKCSECGVKQAINLDR